ncbi:MAG: NAD(P)/FAD-dependent oxidoreductase [Butyrivibrio sp.]|nr:NAD(P)/FAD-dependent oxidoreductase [Acetatifactor muris]MCM1559806.1 NAD(P)/FAD-dependent oxidoreductase [Butyrivibrio sp.]
MTDIIVIGAGVTGCGIARELARYDWSVTVLERASDVCEGTSKANSGIAHAGFDAVPGTLKAKLNVEGNVMMEVLSQELDFPFKRNGSLVLCFDEADRPKLQKLLEQGRQNGVKDLRIIEKDELKALEPNISHNAVAALYAPTGGIVCPFNLTIALAENAAVNGVEFRLNTEVQKIEKISEGYRVTTDKGTLESRVVINAAGVYADRFHNMVSEKKIRIIPRKGEYCLMDKKVGDFVTRTIFQLPTKYGKGVLVTPTVHGNLLAGPTAVDIEDCEGVNTTREGMEDLMKRAALSVEGLPSRQVITSFAGLRAHADTEEEDFIIGQAEDAPGFFDAAGIESPGLTCAPALGKYLAAQVLEYLPAAVKQDFIATRKGIPSMALAGPEERQRLIQENPLYADVVCRCELVTEGEILDAIHRPLGATTLDGVKRRTRAGMGRCQAGFCSPRTVEILARELGKDMAEIGKNNEGSRFLTGYNKDGIECEKNF